MNQRKVKMLMVNPSDFASLFTKGLKLRKGLQIVSGVPKDATIVTIAADPVRGGIILVMESEEYEPIKDGVMPPIELVEIRLK